MASQMTKIMFSMDTRVFRELKTQAEERGITVQELLRALVLPYWLKGTTKPSIVELTTT